jgi:hypothetical protein
MQPETPTESRSSTRLASCCIGVTYGVLVVPGVVGSKLISGFAVSFETNGVQFK